MNINEVNNHSTRRSELYRFSDYKNDLLRSCISIAWVKIMENIADMIDLDTSQENKLK